MLLKKKLLLATAVAMVFTGTSADALELQNLDDKVINEKTIPKNTQEAVYKTSQDEELPEEEFVKNRSYTIKANRNKGDFKRGGYSSFLKDAGITRNEFEEARKNGTLEDLFEEHGIEKPSQGRARFRPEQGSYRQNGRGKLPPQLEEAGITLEEFEEARRNGTIEELLEEHGIEDSSSSSNSQTILKIINKLF